MTKEVTNTSEAPAEPEITIEGFPTADDWINKDTQAIAVASYEIARVLAPLTQACIQAAKSHLPTGAKMSLVMRAKKAARDVYLAVPNQHREAVEAVVGEELAKLFGVEDEEATAAEKTPEQIEAEISGVNSVTRESDNPPAAKESADATNAQV